MTNETLSSCLQNTGNSGAGPDFGTAVCVQEHVGCHQDALLAFLQQPLCQPLRLSAVKAQRLTQRGRQPL